MSFENKGSVVASAIISMDPDRSGNYICTGVADDVVFQRAYDEVYAKGGGLIYVKASDTDYAFASTVNPTDNSRLVGESKQSDSDLTAGVRIVAECSAFTCAGIENTSFEHMMIHASGTQDYGIWIDTMETVHILGCEIEGFDDNVFFDNCGGVDKCFTIKKSILTNGSGKNSLRLAGCADLFVTSTDMTRVVVEDGDSATQAQRSNGRINFVGCRFHFQDWATEGIHISGEDFIMLNVTHCLAENYTNTFVYTQAFGTYQNNVTLEFNEYYGAGDAFRITGVGTYAVCWLKIEGSQRQKVLVGEGVTENIHVYRDRLENYGAAYIADGGVITHGLCKAPEAPLVTASIAGEFASVTATAAANFTVAIKTHTGAAGTTQTIYWHAFAYEHL